MYLRRGGGPRERHRWSTVGLSAAALEASANDLQPPPSAPLRVRARPNDQSRLSLRLLEGPTAPGWVDGQVMTVRVVSGQLVWVLMMEYAGHEWSFIVVSDTFLLMNGLHEQDEGLLGKFREHGFKIFYVHWVRLGISCENFILPRTSPGMVHSRVSEPDTNSYIAVCLSKPNSCLAWERQCLCIV